MKNITIILLLLKATASFAQIKSTHTEMYFEMFFLDSSKTPHQNEEIEVFSVHRKKSQTFFTDSSGRIELMLPHGFWKFYAKKLGVKKQLRTYIVQEKHHGEYPDAKRDQIYEWDTLFLFNIQFESTKSTIDSKSFSVLDKISEYLNRKKDEKIEIIGHTDNSGNPEANLILSQERTEAIKAYLVKKGITPHRLVTLGKGDTQPITDNSTEKGRAENRRTEIRAF